MDQVLNGMQIKVMPEVSDNEQIIFEHKLAVAQTRETAIQYHLESVIQTVDDNMWDKIIATTDLIQQEIEGDLIQWETFK